MCVCLFVCVYVCVCVFVVLVLVAQDGTENEEEKPTIDSVNIYQILIQFCGLIWFPNF